MTQSWSPHIEPLLTNQGASQRPLYPLDRPWSRLGTAKGPQLRNTAMHRISRFRSACSHAVRQLSSLQRSFRHSSPRLTFKYGFAFMPVIAIYPW